MPEIASDDNFTIHPQLNNLLRVLTICKGFALYFGSCNTVQLRESLVVSLKEKLHRPIIELLLDPHNPSSIVEQAEHLMASADESAVLFIYGLEKLDYLKDRYVIQELQWHRERYGQLKCPIVFWMPDFLITKIFHQAPDFMDWRSGIYEFALSKPEKTQLMESTWQRANENFVEQLTIEEKERWIVSIKNLLLELGGDENNKTKTNLLNRLGLLHHSLGQFDKALGCHRENLALQQLSGDKKGEGATLNNISQIYDAQGDYATALRYLQDSLKIRQEIGDKEGEGATLNNLSTIAQNKGNYKLALQYSEQDLKICREIGYKRGEGTALNNISQIYKVKGDYATALRFLQDSLKIQQEIGDKQGEGTTLNNLAATVHAQGNYTTALRYFQESLKIQQEIGDVAGMCRTLFNIGYIHWQNEEKKEAFAKWVAAYQIAKKIGLAQALDALDSMAKQLGGDGLAFWEQFTE